MLQFKERAMQEKVLFIFFTCATSTDRNPLLEIKRTHFVTAWDGSFAHVAPCFQGDYRITNFKIDKNRNTVKPKDIVIK